MVRSRKGRAGGDMPRTVPQDFLPGKGAAGKGGIGRAGPGFRGRGAQPSSGARGRSTVSSVPESRLVRISILPPWMRVMSRAA